MIKATYQEAFDELYLKERIEKLLPDRNFYFFQIKETEDEQKQEFLEIQRFLNDSVKCPQVYIE